MSVKQFQKLASRSVIRNWIGCWSQAVKIVFPIWTCGESASKIVLWLLGILLRIKAIRSGMPDIDLRALDWLAGLEVRDYSVHPLLFSELAE